MTETEMWRLGTLFVFGSTCGLVMMLLETPVLWKIPVWVGLCAFGYVVGANEVDDHDDDNYYF